MKLFKLMATTAITTMAVAAMSVSASAMTADYSYDADKGIGTVALEGIPAVTDGNQVTMLVLTSDALKQVDDTTTWVIDETKIKQIDQDDSISSAVVGDLAAEIDATNKAIAEAALADGKVEEAELANWIEDQTYYVRVGVNGGIETATFVAPTTVDKPEVSGEEPDEPESQWGMGDVNMDGYPDTLDADDILNFEVGNIDFTEEQILLGDVNEDGYPDTLDADEILNFEVGNPSELDKYYY